MFNTFRRVGTAFLCLSLLFALTIGIFTPYKAQAQFPGKNITFVIPVSPGGGFDTFARLLVPYLQKHLPGNPNVIVNNVPGGEWNIGINKMYRSKPDGNTIGIFNWPANAVNQVLGRAKFDLSKVTWLGNISEVTYVMCLSPKSKFRTLQDLQKAPEVTSAVVGLASTAGLGTIIAAQRMGVKMKYIPHDGSTEAILSAIRGDVDWVQYPLSTLKKSIVDSKDLIPLWIYSSKRTPLLPDVPTIGELGYGDLTEIVTMYRPVGAPPGLPKDVAKIWYDSFWKATNDPEFQKKMIAANEPAMPMRPKETAAMINKGIAEVAKYKDLILKYTK